MDLAATDLEAYALFCAPREGGETGRLPIASPPIRPVKRRRPLPVGWMVGGFYGAILGAFMLGVADGMAPEQVARSSAILLFTLLAAQAGLLRRRAATVKARRIAQCLTAPAVAAVIAGLGAVARLTA